MKHFPLLSSLVAVSLFPLAAHADGTLPAQTAPETKSFGEKLEDLKLQKLLPESEKRITLYGWAEAGITANPAGPADNQNFGRLFDDRNDGPLLNQVAVTAERTLICEKGECDWGFKAQAIYGSDARYTRTLGLFDDHGSQSHQIDVVEAYGSFHLPAPTDGGMDVKIGKFATLDGLETIDPRANFFYSHSYIFNFGPFTHTGVLATIHLPQGLDVHAGITRGAAPVSFNDNNNAGAFHGGFTYTAEKWSLLADTHIGPETNGNNDDLRSFTNVVFIYKATKELTLSTDTSYMQDNAGTGAKAYGIAQYASYAINDKLSAGVRGEIFRDQNGFFVAQQGQNDDFMNAIDHGTVVNSRTVGGGKTTYGAITVGVNYKPVSSVTVRPEVRFDYALNNTKPFDDSNSNKQFTVGIDAIWAF